MKVKVQLYGMPITLDTDDPEDWDTFEYLGLNPKTGDPLDSRARLARDLSREGVGPEPWDDAERFQAYIKRARAMFRLPSKEIK